MVRLDRQALRAQARLDRLARERQAQQELLVQALRGRLVKRVEQASQDRRDIRDRQARLEQRRLSPGLRDRAG